MLSLYTFVILALFLPKSDSSRILCVFPIPLVSRQSVYRAITEELLKRGHEIVVVTPLISYPVNGTPSNLTEVDIHKASQKVSFKQFLEISLENPQKIYMPKIEEVFHKLFMEMFQLESFQNAINSGRKFDLILLEECVPTSILLSHLIKAPVMLVSSHGTILGYDIFGAPSQESLYPSLLRRKSMNFWFWEELYDIYNLKVLTKQYQSDTIQKEDFDKAIGEKTPPIKELWNNVDMVLLNLFSIWEGIRPMTQSVIHAGKMHLKPRKEVPQDLQNFLNSSRNGVIYVSFGSYFSLNILPEEKVQVMKNALSQVPYDVLWKWDNEDISGMGPNIKTFKWLPQADILMHPKIKLLITHGGLHSTDEAITGGVPIIGIPFISDQFFNSDNYVRHKIGLRLDFNTLTVDGMKAAIVKVITDQRYCENVVKLRQILSDQPHSSLDKAAWSVEYVIRHGGAKHLRAPAANMPWTQYMELELVFIVLFMIIIAAVFVFVLLFKLYRVILRLGNRIQY